MAPAARDKNQFLFINKDATSKSLSNSLSEQSSRRDINRHVQRVKPGTKRPRKAKIPSTAPLGWHTASSEESDRLKCPERQTTPEAEDANKPSSSSLNEKSVGAASEQHLREHRRLKSPNTVQPSRNWLDPFWSTAVPIQATNYHILDYTKSRWMPVVARNKTNSIVGFTPVSHADEAITDTCFRRTVILGSELDAYCALAAAGAHMAALDRIRIRVRVDGGSGGSSDKVGAELVLTLKSTQSMRSYFRRGGRVTEQLVYNMFNLAMAEFYVGHVHAYQVHWQNLKHFVRHLGGFGKLAPFIGWFCISADFLFAATNLSPPVFNFLLDPALVGVSKTSTRQKPKSSSSSSSSSPSHQQHDDDGRPPTTLHAALDHLEPRVRTSVTNTISLSQTIALIQSCHGDHADAIAGYLRRSVAYTGNTLMTCMLEYDADWTRTRTKAEAEADDEIIDSLATRADALLCRARGLAFCIWLWYTACSICSPPTSEASPSGSSAFSHSSASSSPSLSSSSSSSSPFSSSILHRGRKLMKVFADELHDCLCRAERLLAPTPWLARPQRVLWIRLIGMKATEDTEDAEDKDKEKEEEEEVGVDDAESDTTTTASIPSLEKAARRRRRKDIADLLAKANLGTRWEEVSNVLAPLLPLEHLQVWPDEGF